MRTEIWRHFDFWLLGAVALLIIFGVATIDSAIAGNIELIEANAVSRHVLFASIGFVIILITASMDYHLWVPISRVMYVLIAAFLITIFFGGDALFGAARQVRIGPITVQPSELAKVTMIIMLADYFARTQDKVKDIAWIGRSVMLTMGLVGLIILQPDLSTSIVLLVNWFALLWVSDLEMKHLVAFGLIALVLPIIAFPFLENYQQRRILNFAFPDPEASYGERYNVNQALITIGSGGLFGQGYGQASQVQLRFLKVRHSDFIFSTISAEFGFVGTVLVMLVLFFVIWRCVRAARLARDRTGALIAFGVATWIGFQTMVNIGMNLNLMPVTGLPLPFISHGGSALLSLMLGIGLVESVVAHHKTLEF
ncbi:MAG: rod shape-determining protein RodA [Anaerolineae bacterium]|nr:rod shape-determining protein RodA [Anaerolineae bacterium]